jgi:hypothetical protein
VILATFAIYIAVGRVVIKSYRKLSTTYSQSASGAETGGTGEAQGKTTEVFNATEPAQLTEDTQGHPDCQEPSNSIPPPKRPSLNTGAIKYCRCALLFFVALLVTWVPSTINRVYTLVHPNETLFGLDYTSGLVLPLQGFWNAIVYIVTSSTECQVLMRRVATKLSRFLPAKRRRSGYFKTVEAETTSVEELRPTGSSGTHGGA